MSHVDDGTLHALVDNALDAAERAEVEAHLATCGDCARRFAEATAMARQVLTLLGALDEVPTRVRVVPPAAAPSVASLPDIPPLRRRVFTLRRVAIAASLLMVAGVSYEVGTRREHLEMQAPPPSVASQARTAAPRVATPSVVEATADSFVPPQASPLRQPVRTGPRNDSELTIADRTDVAVAKSAPPVAAAAAQPMPPKALSMPLPAVAVADVARDSVADRAAAAQAGADALGRVQAREAAAAQRDTRASDIATRMRTASPRLESVVVTGAGGARPAATAPRTAAAGAVANAVANAAARAIVTLPGYTATDEESVPATTRRRYVSSSGTALTLLIVQASADARKRADAAADAAPQFTVTALNGRSIVRWHARGMDYELQGALAPDSLVKLATQLR